MKIMIFRILYLFFLLIAITESKKGLIILNENTWPELLEGEWMVEFFAPWCPACRALEPVWKEFADWSDDLGINIAQVDVTANPGLSGRFMVTALPTIYHVKDGVFRQYRSSRDKDALISFVEEKRWSTVEPISGWKMPQSYQMSVVSYFFKLSMALRSIHNKLVEEYGIPTWGSYALFAIATVIIGALLGLFIVCIIDFVFPAKPMPVPLVPKDKSNMPDSKQPEDDDVIEDDTGDVQDGNLRRRKPNTVEEKE